MIFGDEPDLDDACRARAWQLARETMGRRGTEEDIAFLAGCLYCAWTARASADINGVILQFPALIDGGVFAEARRLISYETLLPFATDNPTAADAKMLADRFVGLAALCKRWADRRTP